MCRRILNLFCLLALSLALVGIAELPAAAKKRRGLVVESHVGSRPRDADYLLSPLLDELERSGFSGGSVTGTLIHSQHSITSEQLSKQQIAKVKRDVKDAHAAFIDFQFQGAVDIGNRALTVLMSRPATMARQQQVRDHLYNALIIISMANSRLGKTEELADSMGEFIRSFPEKDVSVKKYGPEGAQLYQQINKRLSTQAKGQLQIASDAGSLVFINERYVGIGSVKLDLYPGRYRVYTQNGTRKGRVHLAKVEAGRKQTLLVDEIVDKSLRTERGFAGLVFDSDEERSNEERRVALQLGTAIGAKTIILVGIHKFKGREAIVASALSIETGESGLSARVPLPKDGAPSPPQLRALAAFVSGAKPASADIQVFTVKGAVVRRNPADAPTAKVLQDASDTGSDASGPGISPVWRWSSWGVGLVGVAAGAYLISIDGDGTCDLQPGQMLCPDSFDTLLPGVASAGAGVALGALGFYFWSKEGSEPDTSLSLTPSQGGFSASLRGRF